MHRSTGRDAPRKGDKPIEWIGRPSPKTHLFQMKVDKEFFGEVKEFCSARQISVSQLVRYLLAKEMKKGE